MFYSHMLPIDFNRKGLTNYLVFIYYWWKHQITLLDIAKEYNIFFSEMFWQSLTPWIHVHNCHKNSRTGTLPLIKVAMCESNSDPLVEGAIMIFNEVVSDESRYVSVRSRLYYLV